MPTKISDAHKMSPEEKGGKRLTEEQRLAIPYLYVLTGSRARTADELGCDSRTVDRWLRNMSAEEFDRIKTDQQHELRSLAMEIVMDAMHRVVKLTPEAKYYDLIGAIKIMSEKMSMWGGVGAVEKADAISDELQNLLSKAEALKKQKAIDEAVATGDLSKLKAYASTSVKDGETEPS